MFKSTLNLSPRKMMILLGVLFGLVVADGIITNFLILNGFAWEWNPLLRDYVGTNLFILIKVVAAGLCVIALWISYKRSPMLTVVSGIAICFFYTTIVYWNVAIAVVAYL